MFTRYVYIKQLLRCYCKDPVKAFFLQFRMEYLCFICTLLSLCQSHLIMYSLQRDIMQGMANKSVGAKLTRSVPASRRIMNRYERPSGAHFVTRCTSRPAYKVRRMPLFQLSLPNAPRYSRYVLLSHFSFMTFALSLLPSSPMRAVNDRRVRARCT